MKYISFAIPCYNSAEYMEHAIETILTGGEDVEILIINDGSKDDTLKIAKEYEKKYPSIIRAVDKENGGHGDAVNVGLKYATGLYFKVVDSDDWVDTEALKKVLEAVHKLTEESTPIDMLISNYVYEKVGVAHKRIIHYRNVLPQNQIMGWKNIGRFHLGQYILMHSVIYRTELLKLCQMELPKHTFYVDNI
ncbi:MAG: glycosyltransferase family A protein, partial [Lachnospiraceae bacterium]